ncbi:MAG: hypothetical protein OJF49_000810 [Ktedonobacterales bacterium]|jgi:hypothetical protein|nr:MAG: hypothetical protein OJF49_000810 [Ktedonobacterales bacterium]
MSVHIFGVRHHGPGCARALRAALEALQPDILLVEGPPDAEGALPLLTHEAMKPPVALLIYVPDQPSRAVFYPFTTFSPEWQALGYALGRGIPARFMDLPQAIQLAREPVAEEQATPPADDLPAAADSGHPHSAPTDEKPAISATATPPPDPLAMLAEAAGYDDHELWWEQQIEQRRDSTGVFEGIFEAMSALRADLTPRDDEEAQREAHMRSSIRAAEGEGFARIAVVCGAWHAPALAQRDDAKADTALFAKLKRVKVETTWIPWTNSRLAYRSGYGAGITSPGWYGHLWAAPDRVPIRWATQAAQLLRGEGLDASSASVIETVRLSEALAAMRGLPMPGMAEMREAIQTVLCHGETAPMQLIRDKLEIGEAMGEVPPEAPAVPLQRDLDAQARRLTLKLTAEIKDYDLDLRKDTDRVRSQLLHRLGMLGIGWGEEQHTYGKLGTFHEKWRLQWQPEFAVALIEANIWGNTVASAAAARTRQLATVAPDLPALTALLERALPADLPDALEDLLERVRDRAAVSSDVRHLMDALPPLARIVRYGDVRGTKAERVTPVIDALFERALVGLPGACLSLDDDAATAMVTSIDNVQETVSMLNRDDQRAPWLATLRLLVDRDGVHGLVRGRCCRLLLEMRALASEELRRLAGLAFSPVNPPEQAVDWIEGVLRGPGLKLLQQDDLWRALDAWLANLAPDIFVTLLPLLRRAFSGFSAPERRQMGEKVKLLSVEEAAGTLGVRPSGEGGATHGPIAQERANTVLPVLAQILGVNYEPGN